jgi:hypothetical protein
LERPGAIPAFLLERQAETGRCARMTKPSPDPEDIITDPLTPEAVDGSVVVKDPPAAAMNLTADAAEISGLRMLDAADQARKQPWAPGTPLPSDR